MRDTNERLHIPLFKFRNSVTKIKHKLLHHSDRYVGNRIYPFPQHEGRNLVSPPHIIIICAHAAHSLLHPLFECQCGWGTELILLITRVYGINNAERQCKLMKCVSDNNVCRYIFLTYCPKYCNIFVKFKVIL